MAKSAEITRHSLTDGGETEILSPDLRQGYPAQGGDIIAALEGLALGEMHLEEEVDGANEDAGIGIPIGMAEKITQLRGTDQEPRLFAYLTAHALLGSLVEVNKPAHEVECPPGWLLGTHSTEQLPAVIEDEGRRRALGIGVIREATRLAMPGQWS